MDKNNHNYLLIIPALAHSIFSSEGLTLPELNTKELGYTYAAAGFFGKRAIRKRVEKTLKDVCLNPIRRKDIAFMLTLKTRVALAMSSLYGIVCNVDEVNRNVDDEFVEILKDAIKWEVNEYMKNFAP